MLEFFILRERLFTSIPSNTSMISRLKKLIGKKCLNWVGIPKKGSINSNNCNREKKNKGSKEVQWKLYTPGNHTIHSYPSSNFILFYLPQHVHLQMCKSSAKYAKGEEPLLVLIIRSKKLELLYFTL